MVDVTEKATTNRTAVAAGSLRTSATWWKLITVGGLPKGDAIATARVAGILAAKRTSDLIPLCHQLALTGVDVEFTVGQHRHRHHRNGAQHRRSGVEMEALTAVSVAALTLYDMIKAVDPAARIDDIRVLRKDGGRQRNVVALMSGRSARVIVASTRASTGVSRPVRPDHLRMAWTARLRRRKRRWSSKTETRSARRCATPSPTRSTW